MDGSWFSPAHNLYKAVRGERTRRQLALGFALGIVIGLLPKGNFTAATFMTILLATRVNIGMGLLTAAAVSWFAPWLDPLSHLIGHRILTQEAWQERFARWYDMPMVPWFALHNTVVLGSLLIGLISFLPAYYLSLPLMDWLVPQAKGEPSLSTARHAPNHATAAASAARPHVRPGQNAGVQI